MVLQIFTTIIRADTLWWFMLAVRPLDKTKEQRQIHFTVIFLFTIDYHTSSCIWFGYFVICVCEISQRERKWIVNKWHSITYITKISEQQTKKGQSWVSYLFLSQSIHYILCYNSMLDSIMDNHNYNKKTAKDMRVDTIMGHKYDKKDIQCLLKRVCLYLTKKKQG